MEGKRVIIALGNGKRAFLANSPDSAKLKIP